MPLTRRTFLAAAGLGASGAALARRQSEPDTVLHHGRVWSGGPRAAEVEALALIEIHAERTMVGGRWVYES